MLPDSSLLRIRASAGSGKTYTLTGHFLRLLAESDASESAGRYACAPRSSTPKRHGWPDILAITFTNRAAAEMKERIIRRLKLMALDREPDMPAPWTPELATSWLDAILRRFGALNVRTIDSLLHMLVRLAALELGLPPDFEPVFADAEALAPLLDEVLEQSRRDPDLRAELDQACRALLLHTPHRGFMTGTRLRDQVLALVFAVPSSGLASSQAVLARLERMCADVRSAAETLRRCVGEENLTLGVHAANALACCLADADQDMPPESTMLRKDDLDAWLLKASKGRASASACLAHARLRTAIAAMDEQGTLLRGALRLMPFTGLARRVAAALPDYLQRQSRLPATLTPGLARQVLTSGYGISEAFCRMGASLTHILIDEFQDTSREQWAALHPLALEALSRGGSLTWVGDVKQAIYSWRGGDARLFEEVRHDRELLAVAAESRTDTLPTNWRSRSHVVRANNSVFSRLAKSDTALGVLAAMLPRDTPHAVLERAATQVASGFTDAAQLESGKEGGFVRLDTIDAASSEELQAMVLNRLTALVLDLTATRPPGDITVLVRSNRRAAVVAAHLLGQGIAVVTENSLLLDEHPLITQCLALLQWLNSPHDELAFWTLVSGPHLLIPMAGLSRDALEDWLAARPHPLPLVLAFRDAFSAEWQTWFAPFYNRAGLMTPYDAVREALRRWRVWERLPGEAPFLQRFLEVLHNAEQDGHTSIASFLEYWRAHGESEKAPMPEHVDAVRVMTMHKSKGLQFPIVIVPWHDFAPQADAPPVEVELDGLRLLTPRRAALGEPHYEALADTARETLNLLYVAWTRAEDELYGFLTATKRSGSLPGLRPALDRLLAELPAPWKNTDGVWTLGKEPVRVRAAVTMQPENAPEAVESLRLEDAESGWRPMGWLPRLKIFRNAPDDLMFSARRRGSFIHACLERLGDALRALPDEAPSNLLHDAVATARRTFSMPVPDDLLPQAVDALAWFTALPDATHWLRDGVAEQPILDDSGAQYRPDLLVSGSEEQNQNPAWTVLEYKTGQPSPEHETQLSRYLGLMRRITGQAASGFLVYLDQRVIRSVA